MYAQNVIHFWTGNLRKETTGGKAAKSSKKNMVSNKKDAQKGRPFFDILGNIKYGRNV